MKSTCKGLEVFDFKEEDGIPEFAAAVYSSKFNASNAIDKYTFLENGNFFYSFYVQLLIGTEIMSLK